MYIRGISLQNFRNFENVKEISFNDGELLVAVAPNASGKTNFLEAIALLLRGKTFRGKVSDCVRWQQDYMMVQGNVVRGEEESLVNVRYHKGLKKMRIEEDGVPVSPVVFYNRYPVCLFLPADVFMFNRGPAERRNFLNQVLVSESGYVAALVQYHRALKQRNSLLKQVKDFSELSGWNDLVVQYADSLQAARKRFVDFVGNNLEEEYQKISYEDKQFEVSYGGGNGDMMEGLERDFKNEQRYGYTLHGPHKDDLNVMTDGIPVASSLSQGQTRSLVVALKLLAAKYMHSLTGEQPVILLDEVLSELDEQRQETLLTNMPSSQILITCTSVPEAVKSDSRTKILDIRKIVGTPA